MPFGRTVALLPIKGNMWRYGCPKSTVERSNGVERAGSEDASSLEYYENNVGNLAVEVVGQNWSSEPVTDVLAPVRCHFVDTWTTSLAS